METPACRILIADTRKAMEDIVGVLEGRELEVLHAYDFDEALALAHDQKPDLCLVGYHFDEARPYRLIQQLRADLGDKIPILLIRALGADHNQPDEHSIMESYQAFGVNAYLALHEQASHAGWKAARARLAEEVMAALRNANCTF